MTRLVVVGDALLDRDLDGRAERLAPDAPVPVVDAIEEHPRPGGAALAAALAAAAGHDVTLVCALGGDPAGATLRGLLAAAGVTVCDLRLAGATPEKVRVRASRRALIRLDYGGSREAATCGPLTTAAKSALRAADVVLVSDYGRGLAAATAVRAAIAALAGSTPLVWDPHPHGATPVPGALLATPNADEARGLGPAPRGVPSLAGAEAAARALATRWRAVNVCVTLGAGGALLVGGPGAPLVVPAPPVAVGDPCGAGDCFAAVAAGRLGEGALPSEAVRAAVDAASAFVAAGGAAETGQRDNGVTASTEDAAALAARVRRAGGTVVATGGCFDLLHAGHVQMLAAARALGDCLIVCLNADDSVRRLKGPGRPLIGQADRAAVLAALASVDAVAVFAEDDPRAVLRELRPHLWVKGGDYAMGDLPEREVLAEWCGQAVIVPYAAGRSTTRLIGAARERERTVARGG
jgi:rfaE bifunctional protein nucleotidyltransferase chain/domain/rfaE bifunctional protein kinase chain/domain